MEGDEDEAVPPFPGGELAEAVLEPIGEGGELVEMVAVFEIVDGFADRPLGAVGGAGPFQGPFALLAIGAEEEAEDDAVVGLAALGAEGRDDPAGGVLDDRRRREGEAEADLAPLA